MQKQIYNIPEVVFVNGKSWKKTPGYINTYINEKGEIGLLNSKGILVKPSIQKWSTTKGTYLYARVINDDFTPVQKAVHQLVCLTYHGEPPKDGRLYEPNHKDGNKHNNHKENLEWTTRKENVQHAFDLGLCKAGLRIEALDHTTGHVIKYNSLNKMSREWGIPRHKLKVIIANHRDKLYLKKWTFTLDDTSDKKINRYQRRDVVFKDYITGQISITDSVERASELTGVNQATILLRVNPKRQCSNRDTLISRYVFKSNISDVNWPHFTKEEAIISETKYKNRQKSSFQHYQGNL